jgi:hypothetical protein
VQPGRWLATSALSMRALQVDQLAEIGNLCGDTEACRDISTVSYSKTGMLIPCGSLNKARRGTVNSSADIAQPKRKHIHSNDRASYSSGPPYQRFISAIV